MSESCSMKREREREREREIACFIQSLVAVSNLEETIQTLHVHMSTPTSFPASLQISYEVKMMYIC